MRASSPRLVALARRAGSYSVLSMVGGELESSAVGARPTGDMRLPLRSRLSPAWRAPTAALFRLCASCNQAL